MFQYSKSSDWMFFKCSPANFAGAMSLDPSRAAPTSLDCPVHTSEIALIEVWKHVLSLRVEHREGMGGEVSLQTSSVTILNPERADPNLLSLSNPDLVMEAC